MGQRAIRLAHLIWNKKTAKYKHKFYENGVTFVDDVQTIFSETLFRPVYAGMIKNHSFLGKTMTTAGFYPLGVIK